MGTCGGKPNKVNKKTNMVKCRKADRPLSFIQQVLTVNGVKNFGNENQDPKFILKQFQQSSQGLIDNEEKKVLLTEIAVSSLFKRRQANSEQHSQDDQIQNKQQLLNVNEIHNRKQRMNAKDVHKKIQSVSAASSNRYVQSGNELCSNVQQNISTQNSFYQNNSNSQLKSQYQT